VRLLIDKVIQGTTCTISVGSTCTITGSFPVTAGQKIELSVTETVGISKTSGATTAAVESIPGSESQVANPHTTIGQATATGSSLTVTFTGAAVFTSATSYACGVTRGASGGFSVTYSSGSSFTVGGTANGDVIGYVCVGS